MENFNFNTIDLSTEELKSYDGGFLPIVAAFLLAGIIYDSISDYGSTAKAMNNGFNKGKKIFD